MTKGKTDYVDLRDNIRLFVKSLSLFKDPISLAYPALLEILLVLVFYLLFWFIFSPLLNNALVDIVDTGKLIQGGDQSPALQETFRDSLWYLVHVLVWFILSNFVLWSIFASFVWRWIGEKLGKNLGSISFILSFAMLSGLFTLYALVVIAPAARLSFLFPSSGQLIILTSAGVLVMGGIHFLLVGYACLLGGQDVRGSLRTCLHVGVTHLPTLLFSYLIVLAYVMLLNVALTLFGMLSFHLYLVVGILTVFPSVVMLKHYLTSVMMQVKK